MNVSTSDSICFTVNQAKFLLSSTEKFVLLDSLNELNEEEIRLLREVIEEKVNQQNLTEGVIHQLGNEVKTLKHQRMFLGVGLGVSIVGVLLLAF